MGLAVSQVRLLALTSRKADIELQMQINSKRKQMLTRKSTELAQQYYARLQNSNIMYATSNGYEDVNYNYLMGVQSGNKYSSDFMSQVASGSGSYDSKWENRMILTNQYGQVVLNDNLAKIVQKVSDKYKDNNTYTIADKTNIVIKELISSYSDGNQTMLGVSEKIKDLVNECGLSPDEVIKLMSTILANGGFKDGGTVYIQATARELRSSGGEPSLDVLYETKTDAENGTNEKSMSELLKDGYVYSVYTSDNSLVKAQQLYYKGQFTIGRDAAQKLGNLISYFGPMISSALQNGTTAKVTKDNERTDITSENDLEYGECAKIGSEYFYNDNGTIKRLSCEEYYDKINYVVKEGGNTGYDNAKETEKLQTGFKTGTYQLVMVTDATKGIYHKNTTLTYFTHMNYVVDKTDTSKREEITAWFNAEQAAISEQETYWDTEITNLSTELNSVNTEIDAVKQLKSNAIKSVFNWGGS